MLGGILMLTFTVVACNNSGEKKEATKDTVVTATPPVTVRDSVDTTMEPIPGSKAPGTENKPAPTP
jgi:hypothetical protein